MLVRNKFEFFELHRFMFVKRTGLQSALRLTWNDLNVRGFDIKSLTYMANTT